MIAEHWKIDKELIKKANIQEIKGYRKDKGIASIEINNKELQPEWYDKRIRIFTNGYAPEKGSSDCTISKNNNDFKLLEIKNDGISINNFNNIIKDIIHENYYEQKQPFFSKSPIPYTIIPVKLRNALFNTLLRLKKDPKWPNWPIEKSVELLRYIYIKSISIKLNKNIPHIGFWPKKKFAFSVTHDCDTLSSFKNIESIRDIEKKYNINSSWNIVSNRYKIDDKTIKQLKYQHCEIGLHGYNHDNKLAFLSRKEIKKRLSKASKIISKYNITGFRSPSLLRNKRFLDTLSEHFEYDSSTCDTDLHSPVAMRSGTCTIFPFFIRGMTEIPITMPQDYRLMRMNRTKIQIFNIWKEKIDFIEKAGGCATLLTHPDSHIFGSDKYLDVYDKILKYVDKKNSVWKALPNEISTWWKDRNKAELKGKKIIGLKKAGIEVIR
jgi:peptidoglycan/xylan/chitin deacetylase (PgdA/CDA1 family)